MEFYRYDGESLPISEWTRMFKEVYGGSDKSRRPEHFWNATMAHMSCIGEAIRRTHYPDLLKYAASAFCWMCGYVGKCNDLKEEDPVFYFQNNLSQIVALKFPRKCGHCIKSPCACEADKMDEVEGKSAKYGKLLKEWGYEKIEEFPIEEWLDIFWTIYGGRIHLQTMESIGFHLLEEAGEEAMAVRQLIQFRGILKADIKGIDKDFLISISEIEGLVAAYEESMKFLIKYTGKPTEKEAKKSFASTDKKPELIKAKLVMAKMDFVIELADTFSWFMGVLLKLGETVKCFKTNGKDPLEINIFHLEEKLRKKYGYTGPDKKIKCYACHNEKCTCVFFPEVEQ